MKWIGRTFVSMFGGFVNTDAIYRLKKQAVSQGGCPFWGKQLSLPVRPQTRFTAKTYPRLRLI